MEFKDVILLVHPIIAVVVVFPLIGITVRSSFRLAGTLYPEALRATM